MIAGVFADQSGVSGAIVSAIVGMSGFFAASEILLSPAALNAKIGRGPKGDFFLTEGRPRAG
jgi:hypothetical protein